jgi:hypothetical protein
MQFSGYVHNYQRFSRTVDGQMVPYIVAGAGGYPNEAKSMHKLQNELGELQPRISRFKQPCMTSS